MMLSRNELRDNPKMVDERISSHAEGIWDGMGCFGKLLHGQQSAKLYLPLRMFLHPMSTQEKRQKDKSVTIGKMTS